MKDKTCLRLRSRVGVCPRSLWPITIAASVTWSLCQQMTKGNCLVPMDDVDDDDDESVLAENQQHSISATSHRSIIWNIDYYRRLRNWQYTTIEETLSAILSHKWWLSEISQLVVRFRLRLQYYIKVISRRNPLPPLGWWSVFVCSVELLTGNFLYTFCITGIYNSICLAIFIVCFMKTSFIFLYPTPPN